MIEHTYRVLGYHDLLDVLARYASCPLGRSACLSLRPSNEIETIERELRLVAEMRLLLKTKGFPPLTELHDISSLLSQCDAEGAYLEPSQLLRVLRLAEAFQGTVRHLLSSQSLCPGMHRMCRGLPEFGALVKKMAHTVSPKGEVRDSASPELRRIRRRKSRLRSDLQKTLARMQDAAARAGDKEEPVVTVRDGRFVIAVRTDRKARVEGIIHGYSQSRSTCYMEPVSVIGENNRLAELAEEEREEEIRILREVTREVGESASDLAVAQIFVGRVDGLYARARFGEAFACVMPEIGRGGAVELRSARNPMLLWMGTQERNGSGPGALTVPVDLRLEEGQNLLIISGPNRGGKTVSLKTLGLLCLMTQTGLHIPSEEGSRLRIFDWILAEIGDDQDIQTGESTFSAHAAHLQYLLGHADQNSLVLIDEPGMGTDPDEGAALAMAVLDFLSEQGAFVAVSTHLNRLKTYGMLKQRAVNASVEFDSAENQPTYRLNYGVPGISHALEIARGVGVSPEILQGAERYLDQDEVRLNRLIGKLDRLIRETELEKIRAESERRRYDSERARLRERLGALEADRQALLEEKRREAEAAIREAREELGRAINHLKGQSPASSQSRITQRFTETVRALRGHFGRDPEPGAASFFKEAAAGEWVFHKKLKQKGLLQWVDPSGGHAKVLLGQVKVSARLEDLEILDETPPPNQQGETPAVSWAMEGRSPRELNVVGYRVDEAISLVDKTIDRAVVDGDVRLKIIHGHGTGTLRKAIREHLREMPSVKRIGRGDMNAGGDAITVVDLH
jgi:DNA mismatch repair protein MutS2